jgi:hypothetical protein
MPTGIFPSGLNFLQKGTDVCEVVSESLQPHKLGQVVLPTSIRVISVKAICDESLRILDPSDPHRPSHHRISSPEWAEIVG